MYKIKVLIFLLLLISCKDENNEYKNESITDMKLYNQNEIILRVANPVFDKYGMGLDEKNILNAKKGINRIYTAVWLKNPTKILITEMDKLQFINKQPSHIIRVANNIERLYGTDYLNRYRKHYNKQKYIDIRNVGSAFYCNIILGSILTHDMVVYSMCGIIGSCSNYPQYNKYGSYNLSNKLLVEKYEPNKKTIGIIKRTDQGYYDPEKCETYVHGYYKKNGTYVDGYCKQK